MAKTALDVLAFACPVCAAQPGEECIASNVWEGDPYELKNPHEARKLAAMELDMMSPEKTHVASDAQVDEGAEGLV